MEKKWYESLDVLRTVAAIGIVMMHIRANCDYQISGFTYDRVIPSFTNFTFLFMVISGFGMCCGYYDRMLSGRISLSSFYAKRFWKIAPYFWVLILLDVVLSPSKAAFAEGFADATLLFGFLQKDISVIGVGWFLGLAFVFYLIFPFYCVLLENKKRAWVVLGISLIYNALCGGYFQLGRTNILYSGCFFLAGGLIYLYRKELASLNRWVALGLVLTVIFVYYAVGDSAMGSLLVSVTLLIYAITRGGALWKVLQIL